MDKPFDASSWHPTTPPRRCPPTLPVEQVGRLIKTLNLQTIEIHAFPYDPENWLAQTKTLALLQYPELSVGAAWKASVLCRGFLEKLEPPRLRVDEKAKEGRGWRLGWRCGFWMMGEDGVGDGGEEEGEEEEVRVEEKEDLEVKLAQLQGEAYRAMVASLQSMPFTDEGRYVPQAYPWMHVRFRSRSDELLDQINRELTAKAPRSLGGAPPPFCELRRHAFGEYEGSRDVLGIFATKDISIDMLIVMDHSKTWGCAGDWKDRNDTIGARGCANKKHAALEVDNLDWVRERAGARSAEAMLRCRLLLQALSSSCNDDNKRHPLDYHLLARLTPTYPNPTTLSPSAAGEIFSLETDIVIPNTLLQSHGIDIFANPDYDTWVLMTLQARISNNSWSDPLHMCIHPLFSLFNHSCAPNVMWQTQKEDPTTMLIRVKQDVKEGEQLFVEYDGFVATSGLHERRGRLRKWLDEDCLCTRCLRDEAALGNWGGSDEGEGRRKEAAWDDVGEKVVFPEDGGGRGHGRWA